jgi:orotate phosphoribosyltransferase-like protein
MTTEERDQRILDLHNSDLSIRKIAEQLNVSKSTVSNVVNEFLGKTLPPKKVSVEVKLTGDEEKFTSFVGFERTNVNEYAHKESGEVVRVAYVKAKSPGEFGYFVRLND